MTEEELQRILAGHGISLPRGEFTTALRNLVGREVLSGVDSYRFSVDLLRKWLQENQRIEWLDDQLLEEVREDHPIPEVTEPVSAVSRRRRLLIGVGLVVLLGLGILGALVAAPSDPREELPAAGTYNIERCSLPPVGQQGWVELCVESVEVLQEGQMRFNVSWGARIGEGAVTSEGTPANALQKYSDQGNKNIYVTDDQGNRYDVTDLGGGAGEDTTILKDETVQGWFLFPPPKPGATLFTYDNDDNLWAVGGIILENAPGQ